MTDFFFFILLLAWLGVMGVQVYMLGYENGDRDARKPLKGAAKSEQPNTSAKEGK
jgi:hypothetical protein